LLFCFTLLRVFLFDFATFFWMVFKLYVPRNIGVPGL
jgi:hypothetical protein